MLASPLVPPGPHAAATPVRSRALPLIAAVGLLALLVAAVYAPTLGHGFVWDDHEQVVDNPRLRDWRHLPSFFGSDVLSLSRADGSRSNYYRPLFFAHYLLNYQLFGLDARAWHALAILHHLLATLAALAFLRALGLALRVATAAAALFALHPAQGESVSWVAAAFNGPPAASLTLLALIAHVRWLRAASGATRSRRWQVAAVLAFAAALGFKESAIAALLLVPLVDWLLLPVQPAIAPRARAAAYLPYAGLLAVYVAAAEASGLGAGGPAVAGALAVAAAGMLAAPALAGRWAGEGARRLALGFLPFAAVALGYLHARKLALLTVAGVYAGAPSWLELAPTIPGLCASYLRLLLWPLGLAPSYALRPVASWVAPAAWGGLLVLAAALAALVLLVRRDRLLVFGALWVAAAGWPALNVRAFRPAYLVHQRYLYLSVLGLAWAVVWALERHVRSPRLRSAALAALCATGAASLLAYDRAWANDVALWTRIAAVDPGNAAAFDWLAARALATKRLEEAEALIDRSLAADPGGPHGLCNRATLLHVGRRQPAAALPYYERALAAFAARPGDALPCRLNQALALAETGRGEEALAAFLALAAAPPYPVLASRNAAVLLARRGETGRAAAVLDAALARHPEDRALLAMRAALRGAGAGARQPGAPPRER